MLVDPICYSRRDVLCVFKVLCFVKCLQAAKHALDTIQTFVKVEHPQYTITKFLPTGFSKVG